MRYPILTAITSANSKLDIAILHSAGSHKTACLRLQEFMAYLNTIKGKPGRILIMLTVNNAHSSIFLWLLRNKLIATYL